MRPSSRLARASTFLASLGLCLVFTACSGGGGGASAYTLAGADGLKSWYVNGAKFTFSSDEPNTLAGGGREEGLYEMEVWVNGVYRQVEAGTYVLNGETSTMSGSADVDRNGDQGISDNGSTFVGLVTPITETTVVWRADEGPITLTTTPPSIHPLPIADNFDAGLDRRFWGFSAGNVSVVGGALHLRDEAWIGLMQDGATDIRVTMSLDEAEGWAACVLSFKPCGGDQYAHCGIYRNDNDGGVYTFVEMEGEGYQSVGGTSFGAKRDFRLVWTGSEVEFRVEGNLVRTYAPPTPYLLDFTTGIELSTWGEASATVDSFEAL